MKANWTSESEKPFYLNNVVSVYNFGGSNKVFNAPQIEIIESDYLIGVWKKKQK